MTSHSSGSSIYFIDNGRVKLRDKGKGGNLIFSRPFSVGNSSKIMQRKLCNKYTGTVQPSSEVLSCN